jgi:hypothetical protein
MMIDWKIPLPRNGFSGMVDKFVGPGATRAELALQILLPLIAAIAAPFYACALLISMYLLRQQAEPQWFLPLFYLKLLVNHLKEEPYRPAEKPAG